MLLTTLRALVVTSHAGRSKRQSFKADATAVVGPLIGGRLDWALFVVAAKRLLPALLAEAILYPNC
jgi:hypothetical protein